MKAFENDAVAAAFEAYPVSRAHMGHRQKRLYLVSDKEARPYVFDICD